MKTTSVNVQITKSPKQYEAVRLGMEIQLEPGDVEAQVIKEATAELERTYAEMYPDGRTVTAPAAKPAPAPAQAPAPAPAAPAAEAKVPAAEDRERLEFGDKRVQQIVARIEKNPGKAKSILAQTLKYFDPTPEVMNVLNLAAKLNP